MVSQQTSCLFGSLWDASRPRTAGVAKLPFDRASVWEGFLAHMEASQTDDVFPYVSLTPRYLLYRVLEPLNPYIVGTWGVRVFSCLVHYP